MSSLRAMISDIPKINHIQCSGKVIASKGPIIVASMPTGAIGDICEIETKDGSFIRSQIVAFSENLIYLAPFDPTPGIFPGAEVKSRGFKLRIEVSNSLLGRVIDSIGEPLDDKGLIERGYFRDINAKPPPPLSRTPITMPFRTGIRSIDACCTLGAGQRVGLFAPAGAGKSTLLGMICRNSKADIVVVALVGERGREVKDFIDDSLGSSGLKKAILVVSTSDESAIRRATAPLTATTIAEHFRDQGKQVLLLVDSITRTARAFREIGLLAGELPVRQGYTPSVYAELPRLLERSGTNLRGSITAIYTVLTSGENDIDPIGDEIKSILDGHIVLSPEVSKEGIRPAIDLLKSVSRLHGKIRGKSEIKAKDRLIYALSRLRKDKDILLLGGTPDAELDCILRNENRIRSFLNQDLNDAACEGDSLESLKNLAGFLPD